ncbi:metalloregulator ArsR/SmtB family transcription factor [Salinimonas marina]|uniref:Metalloregulator ArsR/SmtB family transcription factor n=1 Tax=Salinimonas marina TaxID=2785918 RepID=A0A7S9HCT8_9ALTE|nr:metalloregulator ArsR/SmtB family transcription factor [Salinimonas marina]QPG05510.1 metalloregulator ArsR/SmtB family transcription factor [Salinimonas marina]
MSPLMFYKCLADDTRLKILMLLVGRPELCVCDFIDALALSQPKISRHLADLRKCDLVAGERQGKWVYYRLHPNLPAWEKQILTTTVEHHPVYLQEAESNLAADAQARCVTRENP